MIGKGQTDRLLSADEISEVCTSFFDGLAIDGSRVLFLIPDSTRSCPMDVMFRELYRCAAPRLEHVDIMIALGTHMPMSDEQIYQRIGITAAEHEARYPQARFFNHAWNDPDQLTRVGRFGKEELRDLTDGLFELNIEVTANKVVRDVDHLIVVGPVFPHEVVGFSGGNKYLFPGISGPEVLNFFHWLSAVITLPEIIGIQWTPVRKVVDAAAAMLPATRHALCMVVQGDGLAGLYGGSTEEAWSHAVELSAQLHIVTKPKPFHTVLSCAPAMYDELWVGGKCSYKIQPIMAEGGDLIVYAPHLKEISRAHGDDIRQIGYHVRDYILHRWEELRHMPWGSLAHSTHVKGVGTFENGVEKPFCNVILATGIPEDECRAVNLGYRDPETIDPDHYANREDEGILLVPKAGEVLFRLES